MLVLYGVGGVGKTALLTEAQQELRPLRKNASQSFGKLHVAFCDLDSDDILVSSSTFDIFRRHARSAMRSLSRLMATNLFGSSKVKAVR